LEPYFYYALTGLIALTFFEKPPWCYGAGEAHCKSPEYPTFSLPFFSRNAGLAIETTFVMALVLQTTLKIMYSGAHRLLANRSRYGSIKETLSAGLLAVSVLELIAAWAQPEYNIRLAPYLRLCLFGVNSAGVRFELELFASILPALAPVFVLVLLYVLFFGLFGILAFQNNTEEGAADFCSLRRALWTLLILLTTANFPDVMMPAYARNRASSLFFISFVIIGIFVLINILLAIVCEAYLSSKSRQRSSLETKRLQNLHAAFRLIGEKDGEAEGFVTKEGLMGLFDELNLYKHIKYIGAIKKEVLFACLDEDGTNQIGEREFEEIATLLEIELLRVDDGSWLMGTDDLDICPFAGTNSCANVFLLYVRHCAVNILHWPLQWVVHPRFEVLVDTMLLVNAVTLVSLSWTRLGDHGCNGGDDDGGDPAATDGKIDSTYDVVQVLLTTFFVTEMLCKIGALGFKRYWAILYCTLLILYSYCTCTLLSGTGPTGATALIWWLQSLPLRWWSSSTPAISAGT
jgi:two pore calcium channel protein